MSWAEAGDFFDAQLDAELDAALGLSPVSAATQFDAPDDTAASGGDASLWNASLSPTRGDAACSLSRQAPSQALHERALPGDDAGIGQWPGSGSRAGCSAACGTPVQQHRALREAARSMLEALPREVQMRVLHFLSAEDLTTAAVACRCLRGLTSEQVLWRRLYRTRWPRGDQQHVVHKRSLSWKRCYMDRDLAELWEAGGGAASAADANDTNAIFVQMQLAKRQQALGRAHLDDLMRVEDEVAEKVSAWRRARGFEESAAGADSAGAGAAGANGHGSSSSGGSGPARSPSLAAGSGGASSRGGAARHAATGPVSRVESRARQQPGRQPQVVQVVSPQVLASRAGVQQQAGVHRFVHVGGDVFCCELSGRTHVCDEACREQVVDRASGLLVCPISGRVSERMMTVAEEAAEEGEEARDGGDGGADEDCGGRLARAFTAGYYAEDEAELARSCGVWLRH